MSLKHFTTHQMRVFYFIHDGNVVKLDVQVLVHGFEGATDENIVLQFNGDFVLNQRLEEAEE
jgi:hypothetical protein